MTEQWAPSTQNMAVRASHKGTPTVCYQVETLPETPTVCYQVETLPDGSLKICEIWKQIRKITQHFLNAPNSSLPERKRETKTAEEYCWATTQAPRRSCYGRSGSGVLQLYMHTCTTDHAHTEFRIAQGFQIVTMR